MELEIIHIDAYSGIAMVKFDNQTTWELAKSGCKHLFFWDEIDEETGEIVKPYIITDYRVPDVELDESKFTGCSARISSAIRIYHKYMKKRSNGMMAEKAYSEAVKEVSRELGVNVATIYDKVGRQMNQTNYDFRRLITKAYEDDDISELQNTLDNYAVNLADKACISNYLPEIYRFND